MQSSWLHSRLDFIVSFDDSSQRQSADVEQILESPWAVCTYATMAVSILNVCADLYLLMGVIISSAVLPATLSLMWSKQNTIAATATPFLGLICSLTAWLVTAKREGGNLSVDSTGSK